MRKDNSLKVNRKRQVTMWSIALFTMLCSLFVSSSCSSIDCPVNNTVETLYGIYDSNGEKLTLTDTLSVYTQRSDGTDTLLLNRAVGVSSFNLPISYSQPEDILMFRFFTDGHEALDTIWIKKENMPRFESVDCNAAFFHTLTSVRYTNNFIDSLVINHPTVDYDNTRIHFRLYPKRDS